MRTAIFVVLCTLIVSISSQRVTAQDYRPDVGYTKLAAEQGAAIPTGAGIRVEQVEADVSSGNDPYEYVPDTTQFPNQTFVIQSPSPKTSGHATMVGENFYGAQSITPGITIVDSYEADYWIQPEFLKTGQTGVLPAVPIDRVGNNSYSGDFGTISLNVDALSRLDYVVQHDNLINVVAVNNGGAQPIFGDSFNSITVGITAGSAASGTVVETGYGSYATSRVAPNLVAPAVFTSFATPIVSSAATLLVQYAENNPSLSSGTVSTRTPGQHLQYAETADVIKAALMAGADRAVTDSSTGYSITNYGQTVNGVNYATSNNLDSRYGAGQVNIYNSFHIIAGGQQAPTTGTSTVHQYGFDYQPASANTAVEDYRFTGDTGISATLTWNAHVDNSLNTTLATFYLALLQINSDGSTSVVDSSASVVDNTQNLFLTNLNGALTYEMEVSRADNLGTWDYGIAWQLTPTPELGTASIALLMLVANCRRPTRRVARQPLAASQRG